MDDTGLYFYNARYYDATIGRFISADTIVPNYMNPQTLNRYSYCLNNPLKYIDPSGHLNAEDYPASEGWYPITNAGGDTIGYQRGPGAAPGSVPVMGSNGNFIPGAYLDFGAAASSILYVQFTNCNPYAPLQGWHWYGASIFYEDGSRQTFDYYGEYRDSQPLSYWKQFRVHESIRGPRQWGENIALWQTQGESPAFLTIGESGASYDFNNNAALSVNLFTLFTTGFHGDDWEVSVGYGFGFDFDWNEGRFGFKFITIDLPHWLWNDDQTFSIEDYMNNCPSCP